MDFILPPTLPAGGIPWEKVLPPLIPRLNGTYGQYNWSPKLLIPETDNSSAEVGQYNNNNNIYFGSTELHETCYLMAVYRGNSVGWQCTLSASKVVA